MTSEENTITLDPMDLLVKVKDFIPLDSVLSFILDQLMADMSFIVSTKGPDKLVVRLIKGDDVLFDKTW